MRLTINNIFILVFILISIKGIAQIEEYVIHNLESNTKYADFGSSYYQGDLIFASARPNDNESRRDWTNDQPFLDIFKGKIVEQGEIEDIRSFSKSIDTKYHESNAVFTKDGKYIYFTRNNYHNKKFGKDKEGWNNLKLFRAEIDESGAWVNINPLPFNSDDYSTGHPALSPDEKYLYFTSDRPGSLGKTDIYRVAILEDGYSEPENLGSNVNSDQQEMFPYISTTGKLYYATDDQSIGGVDIAFVDLNSLTLGKTILPEPINTSSDDFAFVIDEHEKKGYFSSDRPGGHGSDDIYYFEIVPVVCNQTITGVVRDQHTGSLLPNSMVTIYSEGEEIGKVTVGDDAVFSFDSLSCNTKYEIKAINGDYTQDLEIVETNDDKDNVAELVFALEKSVETLPVGEVVNQESDCQTRLNNVSKIYFDLDKYYIRDDAKASLKEVAEIMKSCPDIHVIAGSHTDSRASHRYNEKLSTNRAKSTVRYLISLGVDKSRLKAEGYGETQLVNNCSDGVNCTEKEHQKNRRTEFIIIH